MNIRTIVIAVATVAALSPAISNASPEKQSLKACANAFASSITAPGAAEPGATAPSYKLVYHRDTPSPLMEFPRDFTFMLEAHDKAGVAIARAECSTNSNGVVTTISAIPLSAKFNPLASAF